MFAQQQLKSPNQVQHFAKQLMNHQKNYTKIVKIATVAKFQRIGNRNVQNVNVERDR